MMAFVNFRKFRLPLENQFLLYASLHATCHSSHFLTTGTQASASARACLAGGSWYGSWYGGWYGSWCRAVFWGAGPPGGLSVASVFAPCDIPYFFSNLAVCRLVAML